MKSLQLDKGWRLYVAEMRSRQDFGTFDIRMGSAWNQMYADIQTAQLFL